MINRKDVITMRVPFPDISSDLAVFSHMYICQQQACHRYGFVKCQTLKPQMLINSVMRHYWDEEADMLRNPFQRKTRIDCDKLFTTQAVQYDDRLKTSSRPDVIDDVISNIDIELLADGFNTYPLDENALMTLNPLITPVGGR